MASQLEPLILDMMEWLVREPRSYTQTLDAWRTSCPRLTVWEDAVDRGLVRRERANGETLVRVTDAGVELLRRYRAATSTV